MPLRQRLRRWEFRRPSGWTPNNHVPSQQEASVCAQDVGREPGTADAGVQLDRYTALGERQAAIDPSTVLTAGSLCAVSEVSRLPQGRGDIFNVALSQ